MTENNLVKFCSDDITTNEIIVSRILPDNSTEPIGKIYPDLSQGEDSLIYLSTNNLGEEIFPPSDDFIAIEKRFEQYAKELSYQSLMEEMQKEAEESETREESIAKIRYLKNVNREFNHFNKLITKTLNL